MTKARDIADFKFENIVDTGTEGTKVATGTTGQRGSTQGQLRFNTTTGLAEYYTGTQFKSIDAPPAVTSISPANIESSDLPTNLTITGSGFGNAVGVTFIDTNANEIASPSTTANSATQVTAQVPNTILSANEPFSIRVTNTNSNLAGTLSDALNIDAAPVFTVAAGSLGTLADSNRSSAGLTAVTASDDEGDTVTFSITTGSAPAGLTFNSNGTWSGTANAVGSATTSTFTVTATDGTNTSTRQYTILVQPPLISGEDSTDTSVSGYIIYAFTTIDQDITMTVTANTTADILLVGGGGSGGDSYGDNDTGAGGGGAGQVLFKTGHSLTAGSYTLRVGDGGDGKLAGNGQLTTRAGENTTGFSVTANGGGGGGANDGGDQAMEGGSAGGQGARDGNSTNRRSSNKTTPSGWTSYGSSGGISGSGNRSGGGGGGAGGQGGDQSGGTNDANSIGGAGGAGVDMSSTFGTAFGESGWFAGGGGGASYRGPNNSTPRTDAAQGGQGGGGNGNWSNDYNTGGNSGNYQHGYSTAINGTDGTGGGGGGGAEDSQQVSGRGSASGFGGSGIILVRVAA